MIIADMRMSFYRLGAEGKIVALLLPSAVWTLYWPMRWTSWRDVFFPVTCLLATCYSPGLLTQVACWIFLTMGATSMCLASFFPIFRFLPVAFLARLGLWESRNEVSASVLVFVVFYLGLRMMAEPGYSEGLTRWGNYIRFGASVRVT